MSGSMDQHDDSSNAERRQQILDAALKVFSTKGFDKATNKDIARAAGGISPGLIYWYFKDKEDLLMSIVRERATVLELAEHPEQLLDLPPREGIALIARAYLNIFKTPGTAAFFRMMLGTFVRFPQIADLFYRMAAGKLFHLINHYLQLNIERGLFRPHDTTISARALIGMIMVQVLARELLHQPEALATADEQIVETVADMFVRGLEVSN
jgi:AcrR family transcriptional regulator